MLNFFRRRARAEQIRFIYVNQLAVYHLLELVKTSEALNGRSGGPASVKVQQIRDIVDNHVVDLGAETLLSPEQMKQEHEIRRWLQERYTSYADGMNAARSLSSGKDHLPTFEQKFQPEKGWSSFSDKHWSDMIQKAVSGD